MAADCLGARFGFGFVEMNGSGDVRALKTFRITDVDPHNFGLSGAGLFDVQLPERFRGAPLQMKRIGCVSKEAGHQQQKTSLKQGRSQERN
jgi:hypothetical protein